MHEKNPDSFFILTKDLTPTEATVVETDSYTFIVEQLVFRYFTLSA